MDFLPFLVGADGWMDGWVMQITNLWLYQSLALPGEVCFFLHF